MNTTNRDTADLVRSIREGRTSFEELIRLYQDSVWRTVYRIAGNYHDAEDIVQETFVRVYRFLDSYDSRKPFEGWIRKIAVNAAMTHLKKKKHSEHAGESYARHKTAETPDGVGSSLGETAAREVERLLDFLKPAHRMAFALYYMDGLSVSEVSEAMSKKEPTVKSYLFRARCAVRRLLNEKGVDLP